MTDKETNHQVIKNDPPGKKAFKRLLRNKPAVLGIIVILLSIFTAIFCHLIAPDITPDANEQILQLETHPPGFKIKLLKVVKDQPLQKSNLFKRILFGQTGDYIPLPITTYRFEDSLIIVQEYRGIEAPTREKKLSMARVAYPISSTNRTITYNANKIQFMDQKGNEIQTTREELQKKIESEHIGDRKFLLGSDKFGRDVLSRLIVGVRVSLSVGIVSVFISLFIGIVLGSLAGYFRGKVDDVIMWLINVFWSIPTLLLAMGLTISVEGNNFLLIYIAVGLTMWVEMARIVRGQFLSIREKEFVEAARSLGFSHYRTIFKHILPNIWGPVIVIMAANFATAILIEAGLSFIGLGVQPPKPSWGSMLNEYWSFIGTSKSFLAFFPGIAIMILVLAFNLIGNGLRDALDVKTSMQ